jgi:5-methylcytosine-specific restriction endonuclease McrA
VPTLEDYKKEQQVAVKALLDFEHELNTTCVSVQAVADEIHVKDLGTILEKCRRSYEKVRQVLSIIFDGSKLHEVYLSRCTPVVDTSIVLKPRPCLDYYTRDTPVAATSIILEPRGVGRYRSVPIWARIYSIDETFRGYFESLLESLRDAQSKASNGTNIWQALFKGSHQEIWLPLECAISVIESYRTLSVYDNNFAMRTSFIMPLQLLQKRDFTHRGHTYSLRIADHLHDTFVPQWENKFQDLTRYHNAFVQEFKQSFWPNMQLILRAVKHPLLQEVSGFKTAGPAIANFENLLSAWVTRTEAREFHPENWLQGYLKREELLPHFGVWPFPRILSKETLRKRIRDYKRKVKELKLKIAVLEKAHKDEALHSKLQELQDEVSEHELEKAAAAAHWGDIRKTAPLVRSRIEKEVAGGSNCPYCGDGLGANWHADHIYPVKLGGLSSIQNMVAVCIDCNLKKGDRTLAEFAQRYQLDLLEISARLRMMDRRC